MDIDLLKTFMEVRETRHFGRAAENLCITQAAVSARIKQLEEVLGVSLFIRNRNNIQLSSEGERLVPHAQTMLGSWDRARQEVPLAVGDAGPLRIGVRQGTWNPVLQKRLHAIRRALPAVPLEVVSHAPDTIVRLLLDRSLDLVVLHEPPDLPELTCTVVGEMTLQLYSSTPRQDMAQALAENYVYLDWGRGFGRFHARHFGEQLVPVLSTNMPELAVDYLARHGGAAYLPGGMKSALSAQGITVIRNAPGYSRELSLACLSNTAKWETIEKVLAVLQSARR